MQQVFFLLCPSSKSNMPQSWKTLPFHLIPSSPHQPTLNVSHLDETIVRSEVRRSQLLKADDGGRFSQDS